MNKIVSDAWPDFQGADNVIESKNMDKEQHYKADDAEPVAEKDELQGWKYIYLF